MYVPLLGCERQDLGGRGDEGEGLVVEGGELFAWLLGGGGGSDAGGEGLEFAAGGYCWG